MPILIDFSQVVISNILADIGTNKRKNEPIDEDLIRHMILNTLRSHKNRFTKDFGRLIICVDSKHYWRKDVFPLYKARRKEDRETSKLDWNTIFNTLGKIKNELIEFFPYQVLEVYGTEADDVIAVCCNKLKTSEKVIIISNDKDFISLLDRNVSLYRPLTEELFNFQIENKLKGLL